MSIRTPSTTQSRQSLLDLQRTKERLALNSARLTSGKRLTSPGDDPTAAAAILDFGNSIQTNTQSIKSADSALSFLSLSEDVVNAAVEANIRLQELSVSGSSSSGSEIDAILSNLMSLANTQVQGKYLFAGAKTMTKPFDLVVPAPASSTFKPLTGTAAIGPVSYAGDDKSISLDVTTSTTVATNVTGSEVFFGSGGQGSSTDFFAVAVRLRDALAAGNSANVQQAATDLKGILDNLNLVLTKLGGRQAGLLGLKDTLSGFNVTLQGMQNTKQDTDFPATMVDLTNDQTVQSATLSAMSKTTKANLFDYLG